MIPVTVHAHRLSVDDVYRLIEVGVLDEHDWVELAEGCWSTWWRSKLSTTARRRG